MRAHLGLSDISWDFWQPFPNHCPGSANPSILIIQILGEGNLTWDCRVTLKKIERKNMEKPTQMVKNVKNCFLYRTIF